MFNPFAKYGALIGIAASNFPFTAISKSGILCVMMECGIYQNAPEDLS
jgi:hypothetical protein